MPDQEDIKEDEGDQTTAVASPLEDPSFAAELFQAAFDLGPAAFCITRLKDDTIYDANAQFEQLTGYPREALVGRRTTDLGLWSDDALRVQTLQELQAEGPILERPLEIRREDGTLRRVRCSLKAVRLRDESFAVWVAIDETDRVRAQAAEEESRVAEQESRALVGRVFELSPVPISLLRLTDFAFHDVNSAWCRFFGYGSDEVLGRTPDELGLWADPKVRDDFLQRAVARRLEGEQLIDVLTRGGRRRSLMCSFEQIELAGEPMLLSVLMDVTAQKQMEVDLRRAKEEAEGAAGFKSVLLTNITHEVRTPLTVILGFTSILRQGLRPDYHRFVRVIERSGRRLLMMLDTILDLAQIEAGVLNVECSRLNLLDVVNHIGDDAESLAEEKGLGFELDLPNEPLPVYADHNILERVLTNLLDNAIKFTETGTIRIEGARQDTHARLDIVDTGVGIDAAFMPHLFSEFVQESTGLERMHQGSGLGLSVSKRLVERMGGTIEVESNKGEGSRVMLMFPLDL